MLDSTRHVALFFARCGADVPAAPVDGMRRVLVARHAPEASGFDAMIDDADGRIAHRYGQEHGGVVVVRPDGYIGFIGDLDDADGVEEYLALLR